jgi:hypothetical protein
MSNELKHADVIIHMAKHGFESVQSRSSADDFWQDASASCNPTRFPNYEWRIKPATITYTVTVEPPIRVMPKNGNRYWTFNTLEVYSDTWSGLPTDKKFFNAGNIWDTEAKAQQAFDALFSPLRNVK